LKRQE